jgi:hypothetical protein
MGVLNQNNLTLLDHMKRLDPNGRIAPIVELLAQENPVIEDAVFIEGNLPTGHRFTSRTALPTPTYRRFNQGIKPTKSKTAQIDEACAMLATRSAVDVKLCELNGNSLAFRATEEAAQLQGLNNTVEQGMFYNSTLVDPEKFMGLAPRLDKLDGPWRSQIIPCDPAAAGADQTSIWLVGWGEQGVFGIYPKGSQAGIKATDMGKQYVPDGDGGEFLAYCTDWEWDIGLVVKDYRRVARVCNIDTSALAANGSNLIPAMIKAYHRVKRTGVKLRWYCNSTIATYLHLQALEATKNSTLAISEIGGRPITTFLGIPVRETEGILDTEAVIS